MKNIMKNLFKPGKYRNDVLKLLAIIVLCIVFNNLINSMILREGFSQKNSATRPTNKVYDPDGRAEALKNKTNKQTNQSKVNQALIKETKPK